MGAALTVAIPGGAQGATPADARKKAQRASSYVRLAETITRVSLQVAGMLSKHPYDRALCAYARELGWVHARLYAKLSPPQGTEKLHRRFKQAVARFSKAADAHSAADYPTARKNWEKCIAEFTKALGELVKMKRQGVIP